MKVRNARLSSLVISFVSALTLLLLGFPGSKAYAGGNIIKTVNVNLSQCNGSLLSQTNLNGNLCWSGTSTRNYAAFSLAALEAGTETYPEPFNSTPTLVVLNDTGSTTVSMQLAGTIGTNDPIICQGNNGSTGCSISGPLGTFGGANSGGGNVTYGPVSTTKPWPAQVTITFYGVPLNGIVGLQWSSWNSMEESGVVLGGTVPTYGNPPGSCSRGATSLTGTVYVPNGRDPLPNALVYIPASAPGALNDGVECLQAEQGPQGGVISSTYSAADGTFRLTGVPAGKNIPIVIQIGKWRVQRVISTVAACATTEVSADLSILPSTQYGGDIPRIALVTGNDDAVECILRKTGISDSEFSNAGGAGRINLYLGSGDSGAKIDEGTLSEPALVESPAALNAYDMVMFPCQGAPDGAATSANLTNVYEWAGKGGRLFTSHFSYEWLYENPSPTTGFGAAAVWNINQAEPSPVPGTANLQSDSADGPIVTGWLQLPEIQAPGTKTSQAGQIELSDFFLDQDGVVAPTETWLKLSNNSTPNELKQPVMQFAFNTPVGASSGNQCGRVLFTDYHTVRGNNSHGKTFPSECDSNAMTAQEHLVEYSLFDLSKAVAPVTSQPVPRTGGAGTTAAAAPAVSPRPLFSQPVSASCVLINAIQNVTITPATMVGSGGSGTGYTFSATGLPAGLTMSSSGTISGTPTASGSFAYTTTVTDSLGNTSNIVCSVYVTPATQACQIGPADPEGDQALQPGDWVSAGYNFKISGSHPAVTVNVTLPTVQVAISCSHGGPIQGYIDVPMPDSSYTDPLNSSSTFPTFPNEGAYEAFEGAVQAPNLCSGGPMYSASQEGGGTFNAIITGSAAGQFQFHFRDPNAKGDGNIDCASSIANPGNGNAAACGASWSNTVTCPAASTPLSVTCGANTVGEVGVAFDSGVPSVSGGTAPYTYSVVGTLPAGLTLNASTGEVTGTPTASGSFSIKVTDNTGATSTSCTITIVAGPSESCASATSGEVGVAYNSGPMTVTGGTLPYTFSVVGTLPAGLTLNTTTGAVTGTPTTSGSFSIKVTDAAGATSTSCAITINASLSATCAAVTTGEVGVAFNSGPMTVTGGVGPYTYSIVGTLPAGLTLNTSNGAITGTPTASGSFTVKVTDADGVSSSGCAITINASLSATCQAVNKGEVGVAFNSGPMTMTGGVGPYTYSIVGTLPAGLTLNTSNGAITGTPTASGSFTVKVTDADGVSSSGCAITINASLSATCAAVTTGEVGVAFNSGPMTVTGGVGPYTYSIVGTLPAGLTLNTSNGAITGTPTASGSFTVKVTDADGVSSSGCAITINASLSATCAAVTTGEVGVAFNSGPMTVTGGVGPYTYSIVGTLPAGLTLNTSNGAITGTPTASGSFTVKVTDADGVSSSGCAITINASLSATCAAVTTGEVGVAFNSGPMTVTGGTAPYTYSVVGTLPAGLTLNTSNGAITGTPTASGSFTVKVTDADGVSSTGCAITINPAVSLACAATTTGEVGVAFNATMTASGGVGPYTYSVATGTLPAGLSLNASTGAITGTPTATGTFTIKATDSLGDVATTTCPITINPAVSLACAATNTGEVGVAFNATMTASGGVGPYTYSVATGTLPAGLSLNASTGAITGTPTATGTFTIKATDSLGDVATTTCPITINPAVSLACAATNTGEVGVAFNATMTASGGVGPYTYSVATGTLPAGLSLNASTGAITGTPTAAGSFTIKATDSLGDVATTTCPITINPAVSLACAATNTGEVGVAFNSGPMTVTGGVGPYTFSVVGTLPAGLSLNASTGAITGTPTAAGSFTLKVTDSLGNVATTTCLISINSGINLSCSTTNTGEVGVAFNSGPMSVTGGTAPYSYSVVGTLPAGLTLNTSTGAITGTPTASGSFSVKVTDSNGASATGCAITINSSLSVTCASVTTGEVGVAFNSGPMTVTGGTAPYTYSVVGTLPAGLTLNTSTGAITGTPTASGSFSVKVTDADGATSTGCAITINSSLSVTCASVTTGEVGVAFNSGPMAVTGGTAPYTYSVVGTLPAGLSLNSSTGAVTGTPTASGSFTVKVTDANGSTSTGCAITINSSLSVTCASVTTGEVGVAFNSGPMTVTGGTAPYTYSVVGTLPAGLTLNTSTGAITGTPTASGSFSVKVTDADGATSTGCAITINSSLSVTCASVTTGEVGVAFNSGPMAVTGGTAPYTYSVVGTLPAGLSLNSSTGAITGTPTASGSFTVKVTDADGATSTGCAITINSALSVTCASVTTGEVGVAFNSGPMTVTGGTAPYTYSVVGTLPAGLSLNSSTGAITGTPTASGSFSVKVTDADGATSTGCAITINSSLSVTCASVTTGEVGVAFNSGPMAVTGGTAPYTYSVVGTLPAGLSLNSSTGAITGTPTASGSFTVKVTDADGATSTGCAITINPAVSLACAATTTGTVGVAFSAQMTASGGVGPYTYSVATGTLPAGLTLVASTGLISGTPTATGTFTIKATDSLGNVATTTCPITIINVTPPTLSVTCAAVNTGQVGVAFNSGPMTVTGGTTPYTYSVVGTLPAGLTLDTTTGAVSGTPTAAGSFSVLVTDANGITGTACAITITPATNPSCTLGVANAYNLIALTGDINDAADITGRIAAEGQVTQATTIGSDLRTSDPYFDLASANGGPYAIVAAGGIPTSNSFNINAGGNVYSSTPTTASFNFVNEYYPGSLYAGSKLVTGGSWPLDFATLQSTMNTLSGQLAGVAANGAICAVDNFGSIVPGNGCPSNPIYFNPNSQHYNPSWLVLYGTSTTTNVFNITQAQFQAGNNNLDIEVPTGSTVIINVAGTSDTLQSDIYFQGNTVTTANSGNILFNFASATSVTINGQIDATLLAPQAYLSGGSQMGGIFVAASIGPTGEVHYYPFGGNLPIPGCTPDPPQTISFSLASPVTFGVAPIALSATATSGLPVAFSMVSGPASVSGSTLTINGAGTVVVAANQAGNSTYSAAPQVTQTLTVNQATPAITWATPAPVAYGTALDGTELNASASVPGTFVYDPAAGTTPAAGSDTLSVTFTPTNTTDYTTATATVVLVVNSPSNPVPTILSLSPGFTAATGPDFTLTVNGTGFISTSTVYFGGTLLVTQFVSDTELTATVPAAQIASSGLVNVTVVSPAPVGGTSTAFQFQVDTAGTGASTSPTFTISTATISAGSTATYAVTLPSTATSVSATCLNLPPGTTCSYSATTGAVTITTSSGMPKGTYQITIVFTETLPGAASSFVVLPFLLLPLLLLRRKLERKGIWLSLSLLVALVLGVGAMNGCGGGSSFTTPPPDQTHVIKSSSTVNLTVK